MDFAIPEETTSEIEGFKSLLGERLESKLNEWYRQHELPRGFFDVKMSPVGVASTLPWGPRVRKVL